MRLPSRILIPLAFALAMHAQGVAGDDSQARPPVTKADLQIVKRARKILDSPAKWNRADTRICPPGAKTFSLYCALEKATDEVSGAFEHRGAAMQEARFVIDAIAPNNNYDHRLMGYNNDPKTSFADIQNVFRLMEESIAKRLANPRLNALTRVAREASQPAPPQSPPLTEADLQILKRTREILSSPAKWNRADNQSCPADATTFSLFCAFRMAIEQVSGSFNNSEAAIQEARQLITEADPKGAKYSARLTDYNNDPAVSFEDIQKLFQTIENRLTKRISGQ
jgi:hypothetical protein